MDPGFPASFPHPMHTLHDPQYCEPDAFSSTVRLSYMTQVILRKEDYQDVHSLMG